MSYALVQQIIGSAALIASLFIALVGFPMQIRKNYKMKNCQGLARSLVISCSISYTLWMLHGFLKGDWFLVIAQGAGGLLCYTLLFQMWWYREGK
ncbi:MAG TPA: SemiSWEET family transporter [Candidatus Paceibacterota bacterium]|nr:SemiSWEET family transporter [Candidatus Paceibacterota bacterium]